MRKRISSRAVLALAVGTQCVDSGPEETHIGPIIRRNSMPARRFLTIRRAGYLFVGSALLLVPAISGTSQASAAAVACGASVDPYTQSASALRECGIPTFPLLSEVHSQDGSTTYTYNVEGDVTTYTIPPANFDFSTATPAQIAEYNVPPSANLKNLTIVPPPAFLVALPEVSAT